MCKCILELHGQWPDLMQKLCSCWALCNRGHTLSAAWPKMAPHRSIQRQQHRAHVDLCTSATPTKSSIQQIAMATHNSVYLNPWCNCIKVESAGKFTALLQRIGRADIRQQLFQAATSRAAPAWLQNPQQAGAVIQVSFVSSAVCSF